MRVIYVDYDDKYAVKEVSSLRFDKIDTMLYADDLIFNILETNMLHNTHSVNAQNLFKEIRDIMEEAYSTGKADLRNYKLM